MIAESTDELRAAGDRIEALYDELQRTAEATTLARAEELVRIVSRLYSAAITRMLELARTTDPSLVETYASDDLVASVLLAVGIHPDDLATRVEVALSEVRPLLATHGGDVELLGVDAGAGVVRLRLLGSCDGCPSSAATLQSAVEQAIVGRAPEIERIEVDQSSEDASPVPVILGTKPRFEACPSEMVGA